MTDSTPPQHTNRWAKYDEGDPYEGEDLSTYPDWWRRNIKEFRKYGMQPYRPPYFLDGEPAPSLIADLVDELGVTVRFHSPNPHMGGDWEIWVDDAFVESIDRKREPNGIIKYHITSEQFESIIRQAVSDEEGH